MNHPQKMLKALNHKVECLSNDMYRHMCSLKPMVKAGRLKVKCVDTYSWRESKDVDFMKQETTSTYGGCVDIYLTRNEVIEVIIWDGDFADGLRTNRRHRFELTGEWWECEFILDSLHYWLDRKAESIRQEQEEERNAREREKIISTLILDVEIDELKKSKQTAD